MTRLLVTVLKVVAPIVAVAGTWGGIVIGRSVEGWSRPLGLAAPGWMVIFGAVVGAMMLFALAAGLTVPRRDPPQHQAIKVPDVPAASRRLMH